MKKIYDRIDELPAGEASDKVIPGCMVIEGGAFRASFLSGALDCLMLHDINMQTTVGISAGALCGLYYASGDIGVSGRVNLKYRHDRRWVGMEAVMREHGVLGYHYLFNCIKKEYPFNKKRFYHSGKEFYAGATNCNTAELKFFSNRDKNMYAGIAASASMQVCSKMVDIDGVPYLDGGCCCKIPLDWALERGYDKILVVRSKERGYRKVNISHRMEKIMYLRYPKLREALLRADDDYNELCEKIERLEKEGRIYVIYPLEPVEVKLLEKDMDKLGELYWRGYYDTEGQLEEIRDYLFG